MDSIDYTTAKYMHDTYVKPLEARLNSQTKRMVKLESELDERSNMLVDLKYEVKTLNDTLNRWGTWVKYIAVGFVLPALATLLVLGFKAWVNKP